MLKSRPWVCMGMKTFKVEFYSEKETSDPLEFDQEQEHLLERLTGMPCLENFFITNHFYKFGFDRLRGLTQILDLWLPSKVFRKLTVADVEWMGQHWPQLKAIHAASGGEFRSLPEVMNAFLVLGVSLIYTYH